MYVFLNQKMNLKNYLRNIIRKINYKIFLYISKIITNFHQNFLKKTCNRQSTMADSVKILPTARIENLANKPKLISIGKNSVLRGELLIFAHAGEIHIGEDCYLGEGSRVWSSESVKIGNRVYISHNVNIHDTNSHSLNPQLRHEHFREIMLAGHPQINNVDIQSQPVHIEDDVWVGFNSTIFKGVTIGKGAVIGACSVVTKNVPEFVVVGNPAKVIKKIC